MKKHLNLFTIVMFVIVLAALFAKVRGIPVPMPTRTGFSSGG